MKVPDQHRSDRKHPRRRRFRLRFAAITLALCGLPGISYAQALAARGDATWQVRTVDWVRDHGGTPTVNTVENWYYTLQAPSADPPTRDSVPTFPPSPRTAVGQAVKGGPATALPVPFATHQLPGEATWFPGRTDRHHNTAIYTGFFRPDPQHASIVAGVAWVRAASTQAHLVAGTVQPGGQFPGNSAISTSDLPQLVASFNSGWRMKDITGGFYLNGKSSQPLIGGQATAAIDDTGRLSVGQWGRDLHMHPHLVAARQNLQLIVDHGQPVPGLEANANGQWGSPKNQFQYTARSALGTDGSGNLIYVAGKNMNLQTVATALADAGAVRGMELDIHNGMQSFSSWRSHTPGAAQPDKLLPTMSRSADRYLSPDQRDFFYVTLLPNPAA